MGQIEATAPTSAACCTTEVCVLFTSTEHTRSAVEVANDLARALGASLTLILLRPTRYPLQPALPAPDDIIPRFVEQLRWRGVPIAVRSYVCGDDRKAVPFAFRPHSLVVVGAKRSWLPTRIERLRHTLETAGHFVLFVGEAST